MRYNNSFYTTITYNPDSIASQSNMHLNSKINFCTIYRAIIIICFIIFITNPIISINGAKMGLLLWYQVVVPTLLPCMILANLFIKIKLTDSLAWVFYPFTKRLFGLSLSGTYAFLIGILCGYPIGAKTISDLILENKLDKNEGRYLLAFSSFPSPMFMIGYIATESLHINNISLLLLSIYLPIIPLSLLSRFFYKYRNNYSKFSKNALSLSNQPSFPKNSHNNINTPNIYDKISDKKKLSNQKEQYKKESFINSLELSMTTSIEVIVKIGIYLMIFSIITSFLSYIPYPKDIYYYIIIGLTEMTTSIKSIAISNFNINIKILYSMMCSSFGGLSTIAQTNTVLQKSELSIKEYVLWKLVHCVFTGIFIICAINLI